MSDSVLEGTGPNSSEGGHRAFANVTVAYERAIDPQIDSDQFQWTEKAMIRTRWWW